MDVAPETLSGVGVALGVGLLIGVIRERRKREGQVAAGVRTHALLALTGAICGYLDPWLVLVAVAVVGAWAALSYVRSTDDDVGLTGEVSMLVTVLLGALAMRDPVLTSGLGVVVAVLLYTKRPLHRFSQEVLSSEELADLLLLAAAALVVWPLLPDRTLDPWGALNLASVWKYVVLVMAVGAGGHVALRLIGARWGLPTAGFFAGFASSTAAVAGFGQRARRDAGLRGPSVAAALWAILASHLLFVVIVWLGSVELLRATAWPLGAACLVLLLGGALPLVRPASDGADLPEEPDARAFKLSWAVAFGLAIALVTVVSAALQEVFGDRGALVTAGVAALAELHASAATVTQLTASGSIAVSSGAWGVVGLLAASGAVKCGIAFASGGPRYGAGVSAVVVLSVAVAAALVPV